MKESKDTQIDELKTTMEALSADSRSMKSKLEEHEAIQKSLQSK